MLAFDKEKFINLWSKDRKIQNETFFQILRVTDSPVDWANEVWDMLVNNLSHSDNHNRAIAAQILSNLAKSDSENRILKDFDKLLKVTKDKRFVTARHCLQSLWKIGIVGDKQKQIFIEGLTSRYRECISEKNCTLIRYDIIVNFKKVFWHTKDENIKNITLNLIEEEINQKYKDKYSRYWNSKKKL